MSLGPDPIRPGRAESPAPPSPWQLAALCAIFLALLVSRDPRILTHAEFWGDDGWSWYPDAYNHGLAALLLPVGGYLNTLQRLGGLLGQLVALRWAPTLFAIVAFAVQLLPPLFIASTRMAGAIPSPALRLLAAFIYLVLPNLLEPHGNLTNSQWHLAALALLILIARAPRTRLVHGLDLAALTLCGLSGPFSLMLMPIAAARLRTSRSRTDAAALACLLVTLGIQAAVYLHSPPGTRSAAPLGAAPALLARIVATQVILGAELGYTTISQLPGAAFWHASALPAGIFAAALALATIALVRGGWPLRALCLFAAAILAAALLKPQVTAAAPQWPVMAIPPMGNRYFMMPMLAWMAVALTLAADRDRLLRAIGAGLLLVTLAWGIPRDWRYMNFPRTDFVARARAFQRAAPGTVMSFPQLPPGASPMWLRKH